MIDARMQAALARLTDNEKECLRRRLHQQTAKEMALELGVSPHAVEKRLKMARTKLGLSSSLEAARLLAASEGYQHAGPQPSDLAQDSCDEREPAGRHRLAGGIVMNLTIAATLALALQSSSGTTADPGPDADAPTTAEMIEMVVTQNFANMDRDKSGSLEPAEIPAPVEEARQAAIAAGDTDRDGKLTLAEYRAWLAPIIARQGAEWRKYAEGNFSRAGNDRALPPGHVAASEAEIVSITQTTFHNLDADHSGFLDGVESPVRAMKGPQPVYRRDENGNVVPTGETVVQNDEELRAQFYERVDKDGDGRISYPEYHQWSAPNLVRNGIPVDWQENMRRWMSPEG
jgi:DNA-binding CsgD family transcriptional regulator